jgi:hypothetical protein
MSTGDYAALKAIGTEDNELQKSFRTAVPETSEPLSEHAEQRWTEVDRRRLHKAMFQSVGMPELAAKAARGEL